MGLKLNKLTILVFGVLLASQPLWAAPTIQPQHKQQHLDSSPDITASAAKPQFQDQHQRQQQRPQQQQQHQQQQTKPQPSNECEIRAKSHYISSPRKVNQEVVSIVECPAFSAVDIKPQCKGLAEIEQLAKSIRDNLNVSQWYKDHLPHHRSNANFIERGRMELGLIQVTDSDEGLYECILDYSLVPSDVCNSKDLDCLDLKRSIKFQVFFEDKSSSPPAIAPVIKEPPISTALSKGDNITLTCSSIDTLSSQRIDWFRSYCNKSETDVELYYNCMTKFEVAYNLTIQEKDYSILEPYFIEEESFEYRINNFDEHLADVYGCVVSNHEGVDIRRASITLLNGTQPIYPPPHNPQVSSVRYDSYHSGAWITALSLLVFIFAAALVVSCLYILCFTKLGMNIICTHSPLIKQMVVDDGSKDNSNRLHLPKIETPDIYNTGKSDGCYTIYGTHQHKTGHLPSMCSPTFEKNPSISSNNYHSDESSSWGKSLSSSGDNSRAFYQHTSNNTATTVPLYDHPPSTGTTQPGGALGSYVMNPTYGFLRPEPDANNPMWTFSRRNLEPQKIIGKGQFGEVWRYVAHKKDGTASFVAVKKLTVKSGQEQQAKDEILKEVEIMKLVNDHPNVIKFLNTCMEPKSVLLIMEYADNGTLQTHLRKCRYAKDKDGGSVTSKELLKYSYHVAKGMEYIASKGIVHRDLATRNILLSREKTCKIADFGLARFVGDSGIYQRLDRNQPVPIKWMAPESLAEYGTYTTKSDVFSVGVLMWEIVTLGATPYDFLPSSEVLKKVISGGRLSRPEHCKEEFYNIMDRCWHQDPEKRPTFKMLADDLEVLLQSENDYIQLDKYPEHAYYNINTSENAEKEMVNSLPFYPELDNVFDQC